tara:strand:- start:239 stop:481 length:243 start_codon:yes stop_codon:yes gene_type:complete
METNTIEQNEEMCEACNEVWDECICDCSGCRNPINECMCWGEDPEPSNLEWNYIMAGHEEYMKDGKMVPCDCISCKKRYA